MWERERESWRAEEEKKVDHAGFIGVGSSMQLGLVGPRGGPRARTTQNFSCFRAVDQTSCTRRSLPGHTIYHVTSWSTISRGQDGTNIQQTIRICPPGDQHNTQPAKMPPPIPRAPLRSLNSTKLASSPAATRLFGTTAPLRDDVVVPPESPRFITLPDMPQNDETKRPPVRGYLPVPRELFTKRAHARHKLSGSFVEDTAPRSAAEQAGEPPKSEKDAWRRLMAESRRQALGSGIDSLWRRKVRREATAKARADAHGARNLAAARAPERLDETYTRGTITAATLSTAVPRDPLYAERQRESAARTAALLQAKAEARKDAVQRLYVEANQFIVTEEELAAKVDELFVEQHFLTHGQGRGRQGAENAWHGYGRPITVKDMFAEMKGTRRETANWYKQDETKTAQRQKIVAGELTGGALSVV